MEKSQIDPLLRYLVKVLDEDCKPSNPVELTLTVGGSLVCGTLIAAPQWTDEVGSGPTMGNLGPVFAEYSAMVRQAMADERSASAELDREDEEAVKDHYKKFGAPQYIHLKDSQHYGADSLGTAVPMNGKTYWRGRLSAVSGWALGRLDPAAPVNIRRKSMFSRA